MAVAIDSTVNPGAGEGDGAAWDVGCLVVWALGVGVGAGGACALGPGAGAQANVTATSKKTLVTLRH